MANNADTQAVTSTGIKVATHDVGGVHYPIGKLVFGTTGAEQFPTTAAGFPVEMVSPTTLPISAASLPLPSGAATAAAQLPDGHNVTVDNTTDGLIPVSLISPTTLPISAASLPLPSGAATAAAQLPDGHNVTVDNTTAAPVAVNLNALLPTVHGIGAGLMTNALYSGTTALTPKYAIIDAAASGDNAIVSAAPGIKIRVTNLMLMAAGTVNARFEDGAGGTALSGQMNLVANTGFVLPFAPTGWFETTTGSTTLNLELSGAISVDGMLTYVEITT